MEDVQDAPFPLTSPFSFPFPTWDPTQCFEGVTSYWEEEFSTGYLEDVLLNFQPCSKRRRALVFSDKDSDMILKDWGDTKQLNGGVSEAKAVEEETNPEAYAYDSSPSSHNLVSADNSWTPKKTKVEDTYANTVEIGPLFSSSSGNNGDQKGKMNIVYPFTVVKQGGFEGVVTIKDINRRILMTPTKQLRHPVGEFACRPLVLPHGPGLSGKTVVAFTRIRTHGRGSITIIRTRD